MRRKTGDRGAWAGRFDLPEAALKVEALLETAKPNEKNPFVYAGRDGNEFLEVALLLAELYAAVPPPPHMVVPGARLCAAHSS